MTLSATLGSQKEISRLRFCLSTSLSRAASPPIRPAIRPGRSSRAQPRAKRIEEALDGWTFVPSRFHGLMQAYHAALETGGPLPVTLDRRAPLARTRDRADDLGGGGAAFDPADRQRPPQIQGLAAARARCTIAVRR